MSLSPPQDSALLLIPLPILVPAWGRDGLGVQQRLLELNYYGYPWWVSPLSHCHSAGWLGCFLFSAPNNAQWFPLKYTLLQARLYDVPLSLLFLPLPNCLCSKAKWYSGKEWQFFASRTYCLPAVLLWANCSVSEPQLPHPQREQ
jgi:hypothetical protein